MQACHPQATEESLFILKHFIPFLSIRTALLRVSLPNHFEDAYRSRA